MSASSIAFFITRCVAAAVAFYALLRHPHSFYILTRWVVFVTCCWGLVRCRRRWWPSVAPAYAIVALIFNPFFPFHFPRGTWHNIYVGAGITLLVSLLFRHPSDDSSHDDIA